MLELDGVLYPIEAKLTTKPSRADCSGIDSLRRTFPRAQVGVGLVVCAVERPRWLRSDVVAIPWWEL